MFTQDAAFNFEMKRFMLIWVQLVPDLAIVWYATRLTTNQKNLNITPDTP